MKNQRLIALFLMIMLVSSMLAGCHNTNENDTTQVTEHSTEAAEETESTASSSTEAISEPATASTEAVKAPNSDQTTKATTEQATTEQATTESATTESTTTESATTEPATTRPTTEATTEAIETTTESTETTVESTETSSTEITTEVHTACPTIEATTVAAADPTIESTTKAPEVPTTEEETEPETDAPTTSAPIVSGSYSLDLAKEAFDILNQYRADVDLPALIWSDSLYESSKVRAEEIKTRFSHTRPDGSSCFTAFTSEWYAMGENIYYGTGHLGDNAEIAMTSWYNSDGHRANMLDEGFNHAAIACYYENGAYYWVTLFGYK